MISAETLIAEAGAAAEFINPGIVLRELIYQLLIYCPLVSLPCPQSKFMQTHSNETFSLKAAPWQC